MNYKTYHDIFHCYIEVVTPWGIIQITEEEVEDRLDRPLGRVDTEELLQTIATEKVRKNEW